MSSINRKQMLSLVDKYGAPLYVYDSAIMRANYDRFINAFDVKDLKVHYACKALSNISVLKLFKSWGAGLDCVSIQEIRIGLMAGFESNEILFTPNNISEEEFDLAVQLGVNINVDNFDMLEYFGSTYPDYPICIRINPHMMAGGNRKISVGHIGSKFGISIHQLPLIERIVKSFNINVAGIHVHTGSDILDSEIFVKAAELVFSVVDKFDSVKYIDFGSGFKVAYKKGGLATDIEEFGKDFSDTFNAYCQNRGRDFELKFEPGKYLVSNSGFFLARTNVVKQTTSTTFVGIDSGMNHLIRPMFYDAYHQIENLTNPDGKKKIYSIVGYICETDTFGVDRQLNEVRKHDILMFENAGAYCYSMASNYNSRYRPSEVLLHEGKDYLIRHRETFEDLVRNQPNPKF
ncbi:MAG: diaminopimelate decarboxylase [Saprospiraceae bacterium]|nr:diaminopimelate decarboxylase [Saprospiraceae bacterium]